jgi:ABC-type dipeptide/oligopeptide/nickel transport system permease component
VLAYLVRRVLWAILLVIVMTFVTYVIFFQIPSDPARFLVRNQNPTEHQLEVARHQLGLDDPLVVQYGSFLWRAAHLDLGVSYQSFGQRNPVPVTRLLRAAAPVTASLIVGGAIVVERVFGLPGLGSLALSALSGNVGFDLPLIVGVVLCVTTAVIFFNLIVDVLSAFLDPRVRLT